MIGLRKPQGKSPGKQQSELAKLKSLWRNSISEADRADWWKLFLSDATQAQIRKELSKKLGVKLKSDNRLTEFRQWIDEQAEEKAITELFIEARRCPGALQLFRQVLDTLKKSMGSAATESAK